MEGFEVSIFIGRLYFTWKCSQFDWKFKAEKEFRIKQREVSWEQEYFFYTESYHVDIRADIEVTIRLGGHFFCFFLRATFVTLHLEII